jgi:hypothetical protein
MLESNLDVNNDSLIVHVKPILRHTSQCSLDIIGEISIDNELNLESNNGDIQIEINFNP